MLQNGGDRTQGLGGVGEPSPGNPRSRKLEEQGESGDFPQNYERCGGDTGVISPAHVTSVT